MTEDESTLERMRARLYAQQAPAVFTAEPLPVMENNPPQSPDGQWKPLVPEKPKKPFSWTVLFLAVAAGFFVVAGGVSAFFLFHGISTVSNDNIVITVQAPNAIASGTAVPLVVTIVNKNPAAITGSDLQLDFPDGTRSADNVTQPLLRYVNTLGTIPAGGTVTRTVQAVLFGSANQTVTIPVTLQYHTANSNAVFVKQQPSVFTITSSPITITAQTTDSIASGQPFTITLTVRSNTTDPLTNIAVIAQYPFGFAVQKVQMDTQQNTVAKTLATTAKTASTPTSNGPLFVLGTLAPGQQRTITITGTLTGTENDQRDFQFTVGTQKTDGTPTLDVAYASESSSITIAKPFISVALSLNHGSTDPTVITSGEAVAGLITWVNSLATSISNAQISIKFSGSALDPTSVTSASGFYNSSTNTLSFTPQTSPGLQLLNAGDSGTGSFSLSTKTGNAMNVLRQPVIQMAVTVSGLPTGGSQETITNTITKTIQVATDLELASRIVHSTGPFANTGAWPPVPNQPTTYTVLLSVTNTVNSIGGAAATMILPSYVTFTGKVNPTDGSLTYDDTTRTVTWKVGDVAAGTGSATQPMTAAFQISFTPSTSQSQTTPILIGNQTLTGTDRFTQAQVGNTAPALTTQASTDPAYKPSFGSVGN